MSDVQNDSRGNIPSHSGDEEESNPLKGLDIRRLLVAIIQRWRTLLFWSVFFVAVGIAVGFAMRGRSFSATSVLLHMDTTTNRNTAASDSFSLSDFHLRTIINTIKLPKNMERMVRELKLGIAPQDLAEQIDVVEQRGSNVIAILAKGSSPTEAAVLANRLTDIFLEQQLELRREEAQKAVEDFDKQIEVAKQQLQDAENEVEEYRRKHGIVRLESDTQQQVDQQGELREQLEEVRLKDRKLASKMAELGAKAKVKPRDNDGDEGDSGGGGSRQNKKRLAEISAELSDLLHMYTSRHPRIIQLREERLIIKQQLSRGAGGALRRNLSDIRDMRKALKSQIKVLEESLEEQRTKLSSLVEVETEYASYKEKHLSAKDTLKALVARRHEAEVFTRSIPQEFKVLERAKPPLRASKSKAKYIAAAIPVLGVGMVLFVILLMELMAKTIKTDKELSRGFGVEVLGVHPHHPSAGQGQPVVEPGPYKGIVSSLFVSKRLKKSGSIGVFSVLPQSGRSSACENIAQVLGKRGKSVLLVRNTGDGSAERAVAEAGRTTFDAVSCDWNEGPFDLHLLEMDMLHSLLQPEGQFEAGQPDIIVPYKEIKALPTATTIGQRPITAEEHNDSSVGIRGSASVSGKPDTSSIPMARPVSHAPSQPDIAPTTRPSYMPGAEPSVGPGRQAREDNVTAIPPNDSQPQQPPAGTPKYDYVVIDTPALFDNPQTVELIQKLDVVLLAVRAGKTQKRHISSFIEQLQKLQTSVTGCILLDVDPWYCSDDVLMAVKGRPISFGRDRVERFFLNKIRP